MRQALIQGDPQGLQAVVADAKNQTGALGIGIYDPQGHLMTEAGAPEVFRALEHAPFESLAKTGVQSLSRTRVEQALQKGAQVNTFGRTGNIRWLEEVFPLHDGNKLLGALVVLIDSGYIRDQSYDLWRRSFWWIVATVLLIVTVTFAMVRWFLMRPLMRVADRLRRLRMGHFEKGISGGTHELNMFSPLAREVETMAESLIAAATS